MRLARPLQLIGLLALFVLAGCATPYQPHGMTGGFTDKKISDSAYWVFFAGNGYAKKERVTNFWLYRCAELTVQNGYQFMVLHPGENAPTGRLEQDGITPAVFRPDGRSGLIPVKGSSGGGTYHYYYGGGGTSVTTWSSKGTVLMYHSPLPEEVVWALDAQKVKTMLDPYVASDAEIAPPDWNVIFDQAMVAHEKITIAEEPIQVKADTAAAPPAPAPDKAGESAAANPKLRSESQIRQKIQAQNIRLHAMFRERKRLEKRNDAGSIVVSFTVTPNGVVTDCRVVSTTFKQSAFPEAVVSALCKIGFPPESVAATHVPALPIKFEPL